MIVNLNGKQLNTECTTLFELRDELYSSDYITIYNGFQTSENVLLEDNCDIAILKKGVMPPPDELEALMASRHTPNLHHKFKNSSVAIAGLGGLGSNIATMLARCGIGRLLLIDFDIVEPSNLNRQQYYIEHLGMYKTAALKSILSKINPYIQVETKNTFVDENNIEALFNGYDIVCEAFDNPNSKATLVNTILQNLKSTIVVSASGLAGIESSNTIKTTHPLKNLYICGDGETEATFGMGLIAPRAALCAAHQANMVLRIIDGNYEP